MASATGGLTSGVVRTFDRLGRSAETNARVELQHARVRECADAIDDPKTFWEAAQAVLAELPEGTTLHSAIPNEDGSRAVCLWESGSLDTVRGIVEGAPDM
jgi:hypothetical protein